MHKSLILNAFAIGLSAAPAVGGPQTDKMARCLVESTTGGDRVDLVRWIVFAYSKHPSVADYVTTDAAKDEDVQRKVAGLFGRLVTEDCAEETRTAYKTDGPPAFEAAFKVLGEVAGRELLSDPDVAGSINGFVQYLDQDGINAILR